MNVYKRGERAWCSKKKIQKKKNQEEEEVQRMHRQEVEGADEEAHTQQKCSCMHKGRSQAVQSGE